MWSIEFVGLPGAVPTPAVTLIGLAADRPPASSDNEGWIYTSTDTNGGTTYRSDGTTWTQIAGAVTSALLAVADGGTGRSSHTAYAVICGGTTTTAAQQSIAGVGTSGQVLTSNGAGALPTFQAAAGVSDHGALTGLSDDDHTIYAFLNGRAGGQTLNGGTAGTDTLTLVGDVSAPTTSGRVKLGPGYVQIGGSTGLVELRLQEQSGNGANYTGFKAPSLLAGNIVYEMPGADGTASQVLQTSGAAVLSWVTGSGGLAAATQAEQEAGASTTVATTPGRQHFHPGSVKAWCQFTGNTTPAALSSPSYNVASLTDTAAGDYTIVWSTDFSSTVYAASGLCQRDTTSDNIILSVRGAAGTSIDTTGLRVATINVSVTRLDVAFGMIMACGDHV